RYWVEVPVRSFALKVDTMVRSSAKAGSAARQVKPTMEAKVLVTLFIRTPSFPGAPTRGRCPPVWTKKDETGSTSALAPSGECRSPRGRRLPANGPEPWEQTIFQRLPVGW